MRNGNLLRPKCFFSASQQSRPLFSSQPVRNHSPSSGPLTWVHFVKCGPCQERLTAEAADSEASLYDFPLADLALAAVLFFDACHRFSRIKQPHHSLRIYALLRRPVAVSFGSV